LFTAKFDRSGSVLIFSSPGNTIRVYKPFKYCRYESVSLTGSLIYLIFLSGSAVLKSCANLLKQAFYHRSYLNEAKHIKESNERLEFLGDAILSFLTSQFLYETYKTLEEGQEVEFEVTQGPKGDQATNVKKAA